MHGCSHCCRCSQCFQHFQWYRSMTRIVETDVDADAEDTEVAETDVEKGAFDVELDAELASAEVEEETIGVAAYEVVESRMQHSSENPSDSFGSLDA